MPHRATYNLIVLGPSGTGAWPYGILSLLLAAFHWVHPPFVREKSHSFTRSAQTVFGSLQSSVPTRQSSQSSSANPGDSSSRSINSSTSEPVTNTLPFAATNYPRASQTVFEAQLVLARQGISSGSLDGLFGPQTRSAVRAFQIKAGLPPTGALDAATKAKLVLLSPSNLAYTVTSNDLARLQPLSPTWLGKSQQTALEYETILELAAEKGQAHPNLIRQWNPATDWTNITVGTVLQIPDVPLPSKTEKAASIIIKLSDKTLEAFDEATNLLAHFPCSIARRMEKRPVGELHVAAVAPNPNYTFDPEVFPESEEAKQLKTKLVLPPGPNNPVGIVWIGLDRPGYGIHGTPSPEAVGRTESHGCFRLANWNAEYLLRLVSIGTPVMVEP